MSLSESFLKTAKDLLILSENIKHLDFRVDRMADDVAGLDRRVMRMELLADVPAARPVKKARAQARKQLP